MKERCLSLLVGYKCCRLQVPGENGTLKQTPRMLIYDIIKYEVRLLAFTSSIYLVKCFQNHCNWIIVHIVLVVKVNPQLALGNFFQFFAIDQPI